MHADQRRGGFRQPVQLFPRELFAADGDFPIEAHQFVERESRDPRRARTFDHRTCADLRGLLVIFPPRGHRDAEALLFERCSGLREEAERAGHVEREAARIVADAGANGRGARQKPRQMFLIRRIQTGV